MSFYTMAIWIIACLALIAPSVSGIARVAGSPKSTTLTTRDDSHDEPSMNIWTTPSNERRSKTASKPRIILVRKKKSKTGTGTRPRKPTSTKRRKENLDPTPGPTGAPSTSTTVFIDGPDAFALLLPQTPGETIGNAEKDGIAYCTNGTECGNPFPSGFIKGAAYGTASDGSYVQITGCMDASRFPFASNDEGGQFDDRFPNGAQCTFGGYGASFIELVEPSQNRFCLRCCKNVDDQENCNSHQDKAGCPVAIPGTYEFGDLSCN